jgi:flagellar biosynthesis protein FlhG
VLATTQGRRKVHLLVNQVRKAGEGRAVRQQLQLVVDRYVNPQLDSPVRLELLGDIPSDSAVRESVQRRQLLMEALPGTPAALALLQVALKMTAA